MATSDKFIQSMLELLDKLIENQSRNANLLGDIKSTLTELRKESESILENLRDKLPEEISREQDALYDKLGSIADKIEASNIKLAENIVSFEDKYDNLKVSIDNNTETLNAHSIVLQNIHGLLTSKETAEADIKEQLNVVTSFIESLQSKKVWIAVIIGAITALATAFSSVASAYRSVNTTTVKNVAPQDAQH
jgi:DNA repair exonuclease SbcCD ATPase subunit